MAKIFYDHLLYFEEIVAVIDSQKLDQNEREELLAMIDETFHHHILDEILTHLPRHYHETFLTHFHQAPHDPKLWDFLKKEAREDIEEVVQSRTKKVKAQLLAEMKKAKKK